MRLSFPLLSKAAALTGLLLAGLAVTAAAAPAGQAHQLAFSQLPGIAYTSGGLGVVTVQIQDSHGALVATSAATVRLSASGPNGFNASRTVAASAGVATFNIAAWKLAPGSYTLTTTSSHLSPATGRVQVLPAAVVLPATPVGQMAAATVVTFGFTSATVVSGVKVVLQGTPNRDFTAGSGGTCVGNQIAAGTCTVPVLFTPSALGARLGAVVLTGASGATLQTVYLSGVGLGAGVNFSPHAQTAIGTFTGDPDALAFDGAGNLYVADYPADDTTGRVVKIPMVNGAPDTAAQTVVARDLEYVDGLAVDGAGNLYVADYDDNKLIEVPADGSPDIVLLANADDNNPTTIYNPAGLTVDTAGDLFVCDWGNNRIIEIPNQNGKLNPAAAIYLGQGLSAPSGIKVDGAGNLLVADWGNDRIVRIPYQNGAYNSAAQSVLVPGLTGQPADLALDAAGNLYIALEDADAIRVVPYQSGTYDLAKAYTVASGLATPDAVALGPKGNIFFCDTYNGLVYMLDTVHPPDLAFGGVGVGHLGTPQTVPVLSQGNQPLSISSVQFDALFPSQAGTCTGTLQPGDSCALATTFAPVALGAVTGATTITDNAVNQPAPTETIAETGTGIVGSQLITFAPLGTLTYGASPVALQVTGGASGNPVVLQVASGPGTLNGTTLTITGAGTISINATQAGNALFSAAPSATLTVVVNKATPAYTWNLPAATFTYGPSFSHILSASSPVAGVWNYKFGGAPITSAIVPPVGTREVEAYFTPTDTADYNSLVVDKDITVEPAVIQVTAASFTLQQGAAIPPLTYTMTPLQNGESLALIQGAPVLSTAATPASQPGNFPIVVSVAGMSAGNYVFQGVNGVITIQGLGPVAQAITFPPLPDVTWSGGAQTVALGATASSGLPVGYTVSGPATLSSTTLTLTGVGTISVTASQAGSAGFLPAAPVTRSFQSALAYSVHSGLVRRLRLRHLRSHGHATDTLWLDATFNPRNIHDGTVIAFQNGTLQWGHDGATHSLPLPNALITFSSSVQHPVVHYDAQTNTWQTVVPLHQHHDSHQDRYQGRQTDRRTFLAGIAIPLPTSLPGQDNRNQGDITWSGAFSTNQANLQLTWQWQSGAYSRWSSDYNALGVDIQGTPTHFRRDFQGEVSTLVGRPWAAVCFQPGCSTYGRHVPSIHHETGRGGFPLLDWIGNFYYAGFAW